MKNNQTKSSDCAHAHVKQVNFDYLTLPLPNSKTNSKNKLQY
jgi:hypothetical protein